MEHNELKPCPFCGGRASVSQGVSIELEKWNKGQYEYVSCENCGCKTNKFFTWSFGSKTRATAIYAWNRRANNEM